MATRGIVLAATAATAGLVIAARAASQRRIEAVERDRWRSVTILRTPDEITPGGELPQPLAELGDEIEVRMSPAPADRGTELAARLTRGNRGTGLLPRLRGTDARQRVRTALREAKQLVEVGEVIRQEPQPEGRRPLTPGGLAVDLAAGRSFGEGVL